MTTELKYIYIYIKYEWLSETVSKGLVEVNRLQIGHPKRSLFRVPLL